MKQVTILTIPSGPYDTNAYIVYRDKRAFIVDAPPDSLERIKSACENHKLTPTHLILTHSHWDHIAEAKKLSEHFHLPILIHPDDAYNLRSPGADRVPTWLKIEGIAPTQELHDKDILCLLDTTWQVIHTPGHTPGGICLYNADDHILLSGDTLFKGSFGNVSLPTSEPARMAASLKKLAALPAETTAFPGHGPTTTIGREPWLSNPEQFL